MPCLRILLVLLACVSTGCILPRTKIVKNPKDDDTGLRFYRPKPYLMVKPMINKSGEPVSGFVTLETKMLPDFSEEYSVHVRPGIGSNETEITLTDGWNLTALNVNVDSQIDENVEAVAELVKSIPIPTDGGNGEFVVPAINVPIGLYEAVLATNKQCRKQLMGFRYVGFVPFSPCPVNMCGETGAHCGAGVIYGLVFDSEVSGMVFKPLDELAFTKPKPAIERPEPILDPDDAIDDRGSDVGAGEASSPVLRYTSMPELGLQPN